LSGINEIEKWLSIFYSSSYTMNNIHLNIPSFVNSYLIAAPAQYYIFFPNGVIFNNSFFMAAQDMSSSHFFIFEYFALAFVAPDDYSA